MKSFVEKIVTFLMILVLVNKTKCEGGIKNVNIEDDDLLDNRELEKFQNTKENLVLSIKYMLDSFEAEFKSEDNVNYLSCSFLDDGNTEQFVNKDAKVVLFFDEKEKDKKKEIPTGKKFDEVFTFKNEIVEIEIYRYKSCEVFLRSIDDSSLAIDFYLSTEKRSKDFPRIKYDQSKINFQYLTNSGQLQEIICTSKNLQKMDFKNLVSLPVRTNYKGSNFAEVYKGPWLKYDKPYFSFPLFEKEIKTKVLDVNKKLGCFFEVDERTEKPFMNLSIFEVNIGNISPYLFYELNKGSLELSVISNDFSNVATSCKVLNTNVLPSSTKLNFVSFFNKKSLITHELFSDENYIIQEIENQNFIETEFVCTIKLNDDNKISFINLIPKLIAHPSYYILTSFYNQKTFTLITSTFDKDFNESFVTEVTEIEKNKLGFAAKSNPIIYIKENNKSVKYNKNSVLPIFKFEEQPLFILSSFILLKNIIINITPITNESQRIIFFCFDYNSKNNYLNLNMKDINASTVNSENYKKEYHFENPLLDKYKYNISADGKNEAFFEIEVKDQPFCGHYSNAYVLNNLDTTVIYEDLVIENDKISQMIKLQPNKIRVI